MQLVLKTLDNKVIEVDVTEEETVRNILNKIKETWGEENSYRLIYAGKVLKEGCFLSEYGVTGTLPIIVLVTTTICQNRNTAPVRKTPVRPPIVRITSEAPTSDEADLKRQSRKYALARQITPVYNDCAITDSDFSSALMLIMRCNYLFQENVGKITREEMMDAVNKKFRDDDPEETPVKEMIIKKLEEVLSAGPNKAQFNAFLTLGYCWCQTFQPQKD